MLSNYAMTGQSTISPPRVYVGKSTIDHAMICRRGGFVIQRHNELRDLEAALQSTVCSDVEVEAVLQDISEEQLSRGANKAQDVRLDIHARGFWEHQRSAFFDVRVCHPNDESYKDLESQKIYRMHENEKKRQYSTRVLDIEDGKFTPLIFTTTGGMGKELPQSPRRVDSSKEGGRVCCNNVMD